MVEKEEHLSFQSILTNPKLFHLSPKHSVGWEGIITHILQTRKLRLTGLRPKAKNNYQQPLGARTPS